MYGFVKNMKLTIICDCAIPKFSVKHSICFLLKGSLDLIFMFKYLGNIQNNFNIETIC